MMGINLTQSRTNSRPRGREFALWCAVLILAVGCGHVAPGPKSLSEPPGHRWDRITSTDPNGRNADARPIMPGEALELPVIEGPAEITRLWFTFSQEPKSHQGLSLEITWDDATEPSVRAPLQLFFGMPEGRGSEVENEWFHVAKFDSMNCFLPMPFRKNARIVVRNDSGTIAPAFYYQVEYKRFGSVREMGGRRYLHARYNQAVPADTEELYRVLDIDGPGHFVGTNLTVGLNSYGWWGEGDEILTVDGVSTTGTGTEDYYGGAWAWNQQRADGRRFGVSTVEKSMQPGGFWSIYRFHSEAPIPFRRSFRFDLEHGDEGPDGRPAAPNNYYSVAFYYLDRPTGQPVLPPAADRALRTIPVADPVIGEWYEIEAAYRKARFFAGKDANVAVRTFRPDEAALYSGKAEGQVVAFRTGTGAILGVHLTEGGLFQPRLLHTVEPQGVDYELRINGRPWRTGMSAYGPKREVLESYLPPVRLSPGMAMIEITSTGSHPDAVEPPLFIGLDAIRFDRMLEGNGLDARIPSALPLGSLLSMECATEPTTGTLPLVRDGDGGTVAGVVSPHPVVDGAIVFDRENSALMTVPGDHLNGLSSPVDISAVIRTSDAEGRHQLYSKNLVMGAWIENGRLAAWFRDNQFRYLYLDSQPSLIPAGEWSTVRITLDGTIARLYINGAMVRELDMVTFNDLNVYPGDLVIGNTREGNAPFDGAIRALSFGGTP